MLSWYSFCMENIYFSKIFKVKEGKLDILKDWLIALNTTRKDEALATFAHEGVTRETFSIFKGLDNEYYCIAINLSLDTPGLSDKSVPINQEHTLKKKECLLPFSENGEVFMDLKL